MVRCLNLVSKQTNTKGNCLGLKYVVVHPFPVCFLTLRSRLGIGSRLCVGQDPWFSLLGLPLVFSFLIVLAARVRYVVVGGCAVPCLRLLQNSSWFVSLSVLMLRYPAQIQGQTGASPLLHLAKGVWLLNCVLHILGLLVCVLLHGSLVWSP